MTTAASAKRIAQARRAALKERLVGEGLLREQAERWIDAWIRNDGDPSIASFWELGYEWIRSQIAAGAEP